MEAFPFGAIGVFIDPAGAALGVYERSAKPAPAKKATKATAEHSMAVMAAGT